MGVWPGVPNNGNVVVVGAPGKAVPVPGPGVALFIGKAVKSPGKVAVATGWVGLGVSVSVAVGFANAVLVRLASMVNAAAV
jgi:hypothetical protein